MRAHLLEERDLGILFELSDVVRRHPDDEIEPSGEKLR